MKTNILRKINRKYFMSYIWILFLFSSAHAENNPELEPIHQLLDQIEKAWERHDIAALASAYSDAGFLLIADTPQQALVLNKPQALNKISKYWDTVKTHQFVERNVWMDRGLAWMQLRIAERKNDRSYQTSSALVCAVKIDGKWKICFGMPSFFKLGNPIKLDGSAEIIKVNQPHPIKEMMLESFKGIITGDVERAIKGVCPDGFIAPMPAQNEEPSRIYSLKDTPMLTEKAIKEMRKTFDLATGVLDNIQILLCQNVALAGGIVHFQKRDPGQEKFSEPTTLEVYVHQKGTWWAVANIPYKYEILSISSPSETALSSAQLAEREQSRKGRFCGIGVQLEPHPKGALIKSVMPDTPAQRAGLNHHEIITEVNGQSMTNLSSREIVDRIKGPEGSPVTLKILNSSGETRIVTLKREVIRASGVTSRSLRKDVGLIAISVFNEESLADVKKALDKFADQKVRGIVLDLRNNQGGPYNSIKQVTELFAPRGTNLWMVMEDGKEPKWVVASDSYNYQFSLAVLIGPQTLGGELLAAGLKGKPGITLLGQKTSGTVRMRQIEELPNGQAKIVDKGIYLTGPNQPITGQGVSPDIALPAGMKPQAEILRAIKALNIYSTGKDAK